MAEHFFTEERKEKDDHSLVDIVYGSKDLRISCPLRSGHGGLQSSLLMIDRLLKFAKALDASGLMWA